ncbi:MAG: hypothetical protein CVT92_03825 [Bacteroidetes bacterium HGW-Bacteroidetes-1]|nr:MAG: hypothetical protein CVT92_03825 [Bacteroidetes bacterium HGW-Bacteroidetes-1]
MNRLSWFLLGLWLPMLVSSQSKLSFIGENIDFRIDEASFSINGLYQFVNYTNSDITQIIYFPFAISADSVNVKRVFNVTYVQPLQFQLKKSGIVFRLTVFAGDTISLHLSYVQPVSKENIYILTSTKIWKEALQYASYSLSIDSLVAIDAFSYKPDRQENNVFYWNKTNFLPEKDFKIYIK